MPQLTHAPLLTMMQLQTQLNEKINPDWVAAQYPWLRAAWLESGELLEHVGWKWWKKQEPNIVQAQIELVDIWHFMLSEWIAGIPKDEGLDDGAHLLLAMMYSPEKWTPEQETMLQRHTDVRLLIDSFVHLCSANIFNVKIFERIMQLLDLSWEQLYRMYVAKNVLNIFRQNHGYKDGTYIKVWHGEEDNVHLERLMDTNPDANHEGLAERLAIIYQGVTKQ